MAPWLDFGELFAQPAELFLNNNNNNNSTGRYGLLAHVMDLYLIRHGETVDNVAGIYAGVRDSALTNHGIEQARRLGDHFAKSGVKVTHLFSSPLSRAFKTAQSIQEAQRNCSLNDNQVTAEALGIIQVADLIEQDFGFYEGKPFSARSRAGRSKHETQSKQDKYHEHFIDVESKDSMAVRADAFLDQHLIPLLERASASNERRIVAVVSHGILLSNLWRRLLRRLPQGSVTSQEVISGTLEHLGGWSNTGHLHLYFSQTTQGSDGTENLASSPIDVANKINEPAIIKPPKSDVAKPDPKLRTLCGWSLSIVSINNKVHLAGLKRQRGGIGSLAHDEGQMKLFSFFKRHKTV